MRRIMSIALLLAAAALTTACAPKQYAWKEEVKLQNGEVLTVRRTIAFKEYQPIGGGGGSDIPESTLALISPQRADSPGTWSGPPFLPLVFDQDPDTHEWFIVATYMCNTWYDMGRPKLPYAEFHYRDGKWVQQPLSEKYVGRDGNMLIPNQADVTRDHTLASKHHLMSQPGIPLEYQRVVSVWKTNC